MEEERNRAAQGVRFETVATGTSHLHVDGALVALVNLERYDGLERGGLCR